MSKKAEILEWYCKERCSFCPETRTGCWCASVNALSKMLDGLIEPQELADKIKKTIESFDKPTKDLYEAGQLTAYGIVLKEIQEQKGGV